MDLLKSDSVVLLADLMLTIVLFKGTLLAGAFALAVALRGRTSAAARSSLWTLAFGSLLALPLAWCMVPWWQAEVVGFPRALFEPIAAASGIPAPTGPLGRLVPDVLIEAAASVPIASYLAVVWIAGTLLLLWRFLVHRVAVELIARAGRPVRDRRCASLAERIRRELAISRPVRLVHTDAVASPATFGIRRPVVLLPTGARRWSDERLAAVLYHELAHVQRHDYAGFLLVELVRAVYWLNPFVALAARKARASQDHACDDTALRSGVAAAAYARHLVEVGRGLRSPGRAAQAALPLIRRPGLRDRVRAVLDRESDRAPMSPGRLGRWAMLALLLSAALGSANLWVCDAEELPSASTASATPDRAVAADASV